ncbi:MAG: aminotransferase class III-fold pyridoxal phosphate-dependent enzyme, partial [Gemmatimonadaceae bacterium]
MLDQSPHFDLQAAEELARRHFGVEGRARELTSERDQNFLIESPTRRIVLKIANAGEDPEFLRAQQTAMRHVAERYSMTPKVLTTTTSESIVSVDGSDGKRHLAWAVSWIPGKPLAMVAHRSVDLLQDLGEQAGALSATLSGFDAPAIHRDFYWDLANGRSIVERYRSLIGDEAVRRSLDVLIERFDACTARLLPRLPTAAVHNDLNDYNMLVGGLDGDVERRDQTVAGIVDFGDIVYSFRIGDLAIAIAYAMLGSDDPLSVARAMVRGYRGRVQPTEQEIGALFGLVVLRLCMSVCVAAEQTRQRPDNEYLSVSQSAIATTLPLLEAIPFGLAECAFREAAGFPAVATRARVVDYLERTTPHPVLEIDPQTAPTIVLDLSIASPLLDGDASQNDEPPLTTRIFAVMTEAGVELAIGRYDEARLLYVSPAFATGPRPADEYRTIHIGLDLFAVAGTACFAPLDGTVYAFADNASFQDYGPVIVLRHTTESGIPFFTLYAHLSRESLSGLVIGQTVKAGQQIATLGHASVNGGWTPHLHLQIIIDDLGLATDFPGVARPSQRELWCAVCPDPNLIARVPGDRFPASEPTATETLAARKAVIGGNLSVAYREPVKVVRGWKQYLYDDEGRRYIDAYNNVPHVGHCHPRVVEAAHRQMQVLSTNTRYLNDLLSEYAERLLATLPSSLNVCYFVNSASEANELALRLTRAHTGARDMIVLDAAYHGITTSLIDLSPYKHAGPGGGGAPDWVHVAPLPDVYRGQYRADDSAAGEKYAAGVSAIVDRIANGGRSLGGFIAETCPSVGGQLILPPGYLENAY